MLKILRRFRPHIRRERRLLVLSLLALLAEVGLRLLEPWPLKLVIDGVLGAAGSAGVRNETVLGSYGVTTETLIAGAAVALVLFSALRALASYGSTVGLALAGNRVLTNVRGDLYRHLQALSLSFHSRARSGELIVRVIGDVGLLKDVTVTAMLPLLTNMLVITGMVAVMLWMDHRLALLALVTLPLFWLRTVRLTRKIRDVSRQQRKREGAMAATAAESIGAIRVVQALSLESVFAQTFAAQNSRSLTEGARAKRLEANLERTVDVLIALSSGLVLWYGARLVLQGALTAGGLVVFLTYLKNAFKPVRDFAKYTGRLARASAAGERVIDLLDRAPEMRNAPDAVTAPRFAGAVRFENVAFAYEPGVPVLSDLSFALTPGERAAVVGESGAGKSTIGALLLRLYDPTAGRVTIDGTDLRSYTLESLRAQVGVVLQDTLLFTGSIRDNILIGSSEISEDAMLAAAKLASAYDFVMRFPMGFDTIVGERGVTLSAGQRQRIAIARAAVRETPIMIFDEPTTGLDEENRIAVVEALRRLSRGRTTLMITHDLQLASACERVLLLEKGLIASAGTHYELMRSSARYAGLYESQQRRRLTSQPVNARIA